MARTHEEASVADVAHCAMRRLGWRASAMTLHRVAYLVQAAFLAEVGAPAFSSPVVATAMGPVVPELSGLLDSPTLPSRVRGGDESRLHPAVRQVVLAYADHPLSALTAPMAVDHPAIRPVVAAHERQGGEGRHELSHDEMARAMRFWTRSAR